MLSRIKELKALDIIRLGLAELETKITIVADNIAAAEIDPTCPFGNEPSMVETLETLQAQERRLFQEKFAIEDGTKVGICENCLAVVLPTDQYLKVHNDVYCKDCTPTVVQYEKDIASVLMVGELIALLSKYDRNLPVVMGAENHFEPNKSVNDVQTDPAGWPVLTYGDVLDNAAKVTA